MRAAVHPYELVTTPNAPSTSHPSQIVPARRVVRVAQRVRSHLLWPKGVVGVTAQEVAWVSVGAAGQVIFCGRFVLQWLYSERLRRSAIPMLFWYASLVGAGLLLAFAIYRRDPVFILGYGGGAFIYLRNLQLRLRETRAQRPPGSTHDV